MLYQNLNSEIILVIAIWLIAIFVFVVMLLAAFALRLSEGRTKNEVRPKDELKTEAKVVEGE